MVENIDLTVEYTDEELDFLYGDVFHEADEENTKNIPDVFYIHSDVDTFLRDEDVLIPLFLTVVYNIDGIAVQLKDLTAVKACRRWWATGVLTETANFQSNLDHYPMTVDKEILNIFHRTQSYSKITFLQLYANTPHVHMAINKYPVSRVIGTDKNKIVLQICFCKKG